jgi:hypothetical protein
MKLKPNNILLVQGGLGRYHRATAIFSGPDAVNQANTYLSTAPGEGVLAAFAGIVFIADNDDLGLSVPVHSSQVF